MENKNDWYERYQEYQKLNGSSNGTKAKKKAKSGFSTTGIVCLVLAAALLSGVGSSFVTTMVLNRNNQQTAAVTETLPETLDNQLTGNSNNQNYVTAPIVQEMSKEQVIEMVAPSVVGIDVTFQQEASSNSYGDWGDFFGGFGGFDQIPGYGNGNGQTYESQGAGSGVIITKDGYIVTCDHVVDGATKITVTLNDETTYDAKVIGKDKKYDVAIIKIDANNLTPATMGDSDRLTVGEDVIAIGNHLGELRGTATSGIVSAMNREVNVEGTDMNLIQHDASISPGSSGGGLFNESGTLIGIVNAKASGNNSEGLGFAIPVNSVKQVIDDIINYGYVKGRAYLGVATQNRSLQMDGGSYGFFNNNGASQNCVQVYQVTEGSAAEKAGIQANDLILKVGDVNITSNDVLSETIGSYNAGDTVNITIMRDGTEKTVEVTFGEYIPQEG